MHQRPKRRGLTADEFNDGRAPWAVTILPFLEQQTLYDQFDLDKPFVGLIYLPAPQPPYGPTSQYSNYEFQQRPNAAFHCPPNPESTSSSARTDYSAVVGGGTDLDAQCHGSGAISGRRNFFNNGIFFVNSEINSQHILDGMSATFLVAENIYLRLDESNGDGWLWSSGARGVAGNHALMGTMCFAVGPINVFDPTIDPNGHAQQQRTFSSDHPAGLSLPWPTVRCIFSPRISTSIFFVSWGVATMVILLRDFPCPSG